MSLEPQKPFRRFLPYLLLGAFTVMIIGGATELITRLIADAEKERLHTQSLVRLSTLRAQLEGEINSTLHLTRGLIAYVATHPEVDENEFSQLTSEIVSMGRHVRNIALARDNVITHIYPLAGNETALGLDYKKVPDQWPQVEKAINVKGTVVAGPVDLVQGGQGIIARTPIYTRSLGASGVLAKHRPVYWGIASIVLDIPSLFEKAGIYTEQEGVEFAIRGKDGLGENGDIILGSSSVFESNPVTQYVKFPNGRWQLAAVPVNGWSVDSAFLWGARFFGWLIAFLLGGLISALVWARAANRRLALHDHLTSLPNRRLLEDRLNQLIVRCQRGGCMFGLLYVDLDHFKQINDRYGHKAGDALLCEVAQRLKVRRRATDTIARIGGDEFVVLVDGVTGKPDLYGIEQQLKTNLAGSLIIDDEQIQIEASIGSALYPEDGTTIENLMKAGDREMYRKKSYGELRAIS